MRAVHAQHGLGEHELLGRKEAHPALLEEGFLEGQEASEGAVLAAVLTWRAIHSVEKKTTSVDEKDTDGTSDVLVAPWVEALPGRPATGSTVIAL